jgi:hypothetical protein
MYRRTLSVLVGVSLIALIAPTWAGADVSSEFVTLALYRQSPPPLVPVSVPALMMPLDQHIGQVHAEGSKGYLFRILHKDKRGAIDGVIALERNFDKSLAAARHSAERMQWKIRSTRIRGHRGYLFTQPYGERVWDLEWVEDGLVYSISTGTTKTISLKQLRATATGLEHLEREYIGDLYDQNRGDYNALLVTTTHTVTGSVTWGAQCLAPDGSVGLAQGGEATVTLLPRQGNAFSIGLQPGAPPGNDWTASISGTIAPDAITLNLRATATVGGLACDSGPVTLTADQRGTPLR